MILIIKFIERHEANMFQESADHFQTFNAKRALFNKSGFTFEKRYL